MLVRGFAIATLLAFISNAAIGQTIKRIEITDFGIYSLDQGERISAPNTPTGFRRDVDNIKLISATDTVPARLGVHFGFRYRIVGENGATFTLKKVTLIPQPRIQNPNAGETKLRGESSLPSGVGGIHYSGYAFSYPWEIVPGVWTIEFWDGDRKLASQSFNVARP